MKKIDVLPLVSFVILILMIGCKTGPDYHSPSVDTPDHWLNQHSNSDNLANIPWWELFHDDVLKSYISEAVANSQDIEIAASRIEEATGNYRFQRSDLFPTVDASVDLARARTPAEGRIPASTANQFSIAGLLSYEIDIWGRIRRSTEAARANLLASEEGYRTVYITLLSNVASVYFELLGLDEQLEISRRTVKSREQSLELTRVRFNNGHGIVSELDVRQAETLLYEAQATQADVQRQSGLRENELNLLLGRNPMRVQRGRSLHNQISTLEVPAGLPSELLLRRPDILQAEQTLIAANANIGVARAAYFPSISLTGALGLQSADLGNLFDPGVSRAWRIAPQLTAPLFNAGRIAGSVQIAEAQQREALAAYRRSIQNAFREVEDALLSIRQFGIQIDAQQKNVQAERARLELSQLRYEAGVSSYIEVLDAQRFLFSAELTLAALQSTRLTSIVQLYRSLGGGWS